MACHCSSMLNTLQEHMTLQDRSHLKREQLCPPQTHFQRLHHWRSRDKTQRIGGHGDTRDLRHQLPLNLLWTFYLGQQQRMEKDERREYTKDDQTFSHYGFINGQRWKSRDTQAHFGDSSNPNLSSPTTQLQKKILCCKRKSFPRVWHAPPPPSLLKRSSRWSRFFWLQQKHSARPALTCPVSWCWPTTSLDQDDVIVSSSARQSWKTKKIIRSSPHTKRVDF